MALNLKSSRFFSWTLSHLRFYHHRSDPHIHLPDRLWSSLANFSVSSRHRSFNISLGLCRYLHISLFCFPLFFTYFLAIAFLFDHLFINRSVAHNISLIKDLLSRLFVNHDLNKVNHADSINNPMFY